MLKLLLKKQLTEIFRNYFYDPKKNCVRSKAGTIGYILLFAVIIVGVLGGLFTMLSFSLCAALSEAGVDWLLFSMMGLLSVLLGVFGSVFNTYSCLYLPKDNDLMLSLPIPVNILMGSRLLTVYLMGLMYSAVVILPAVIVYWVVRSATAAVIFGGILLVLLISVLVLTLSCILGWVVAKISRKLKHKSIVTVAVSLVFITGYYFFFFKAQTLIQNLMINAAIYGERMKNTAYLLYLFGRVGTGDVFAMTVVSAAVSGLFALIWILIAHSFLKTATASANIAKKEYNERKVKKRDIADALLMKELGRFISSPTYMLNCGLGILLLPICGLMLLWRGEAMITTFRQVFEWEDFTPVVLSAVVCMLASMNNMTAPAISLEGKTLWLMQSLPVTPWQVLCAKLRMQLLLCGIPALFYMCCAAFAYPYSIIELLLAVLVPVTYVVLFALFGLVLGLKMPNLSWTSEIIPIKQSASVVFSLLGGLVYTVFLCAGFMLLGGWRLGFTGYMTLFGGITLAFCALLWSWLRNQGCRHFTSL